MRNFFPFLFLLSCYLSLFQINLSQAQENPEAKKLKKVVKKILSLCEKASDKKLAPYVIYRLNDPQRKWKDAYQANNPEELGRVTRLRKYIQENYLIYDKYSFVKYQEEIESEGKWQVWELHFEGGDRADKKTFFAFLKIKGRFVLGDID
ncbi:MAG: hypothetical protein AAFU64_11335 [Bacteroidota bacterium]